MDISEIAIKGKCFSDLTKLSLFENNGSRVAIVFGENGSGKSTIGQAIKSISEKKESSEFEIVELAKNIDGNRVVITESEKEILANNIFVFNEDFILEKIHFQENGLSTIVMLGETKEIQEKIDEVELKIKVIEQDIKKNNILISSANNSKDKNSLIFVKNDLLKSFKGSWGMIKGELLGYRKSADVTEKIIDELFDSYSSVEKKTLNEYKTLYYDKKTLYEKLKVNVSLPLVPSFKGYLDEYWRVKEVLGRKINKISLGEQANKISKILEEYNNTYLYDSRELTLGDSKDCPFCFQSLSQEYKNEIGEILNMILGTEEVKEYKKKLDSLTIPTIEINLDKYNVLDNQVLVNQLKETLSDLELSRKEVLSNIREKTLNVFKEAEISNSYIEYNEKLFVLINELNEEVKKYNHRFDEMDKLKQDLFKLNDLIAIIENQSLYEIYVTRRSSHIKVEQDLINGTNELEKLQKELQKLIADLGSVQIACEAINQNLMYIFYDKNRLKLEHIDGKYLVKSKGIDVKLKSLSIGERNAVALSYFFTTIFNGKSNEKKFEEAMLLVIDDPISSFDHQNKIGIFSYLRLVLSEIHSHNGENKVIILTHDLEVYNNIEKMYSDINDKHETKVSTFRMNKYKLIPFGKSKNDYSNLIQQVYMFADGDNSNSESMGNVMRRLLESFSTFNYRLGISQLSTDEQILEKMEEPYRKYFENSMYRLVLNGESHMEERVQNLPNKDLYKYINEDEKRRTAKDILVFLKLIDKTHLEKHLRTKKEDISSKIAKIDQWQHDILDLVTV